MPVQEAAAGLGFSSELAELGIPASATLAASTDVTSGLIQTLELGAALGLSTELIGQGDDSGVSVVAMLGGDLGETEGKSVHVQPYRVIGITDPLPEARLFRARAAAGVPLDKSAHPHDPGIQVIGRRARFEDPTDQTRMIVDVTYGLPLPTDREKSGGVSGMGVLSLVPSTYTETIWKDKDDEIMKVVYSPLGPTFSRVVSTDLQRATWTAILTLELDNPQYDDMIRHSQVNSEQFGVFPARSLLYLGPTINETDDGKFSHGYQMTHNANLWQLRSSIWISGFIPDDATETGAPGGLGVFNIYKEFDFNDLPVAFP